MNEPRLTDDALAAALTGGAAAPGPQCPTDTLFWELARGTLAPSQNAELLDHAAGCAHCTVALHVAQALRDASEAGAPAQSAPAGPAQRGFWSRFGAVVLHPVPAAVYLVALVGALGWIARGPAWPGSGSTTGLVAPRVVRLSGDVAPRGPGDGVAPRPVPLAADTPLLLELYVETAVPRGAGSREDEPQPLRVLVRARDTVVAELQASPAPVEDAGVLSVLVPPGTLRAGTTYVVTVERAGREVFRQTVVLR